MTNSKFNPAKWPINNKSVIYFFTVMLLFFGYNSYNSIPKENFPEIKFAQIIIQTVYPGTSPENMENLISKPIEDEIKNLPGLKKVTSNSIQDFSVIIAEFKTDVNVNKAKQDVKDAVDKAKKDLPNDLPSEPDVKEVDVSEFPILYVNISGNYSFDKLKQYADLLQDEIESFKEIKRVDVIGAPEKEIRIEPDLFKMQAANIGFSDIENTIKYENINSTIGTVDLNNEKRQLSIKKGFNNVEEIKNTPVTSIFGGNIRIGDIAEVINGYQKQESFARLYGKNVITLNVVKAGGENLILASDKINAKLKELKKTLPKDLKITVTGDQSDQTRTTLHDLINTIIIGFLLVTIILMFFMGIDNAFFVALSVPLSCAIAFLVFPTIGFTLNMIVLFAFLLALGIVVDDAIVVIENTHRIFNSEKISIKEATLKATEEVFIPVFSGTLTTLMPFVPLAFWQGNIGQFMFFLPITLIITLFASLLVAYLINPVFALDFMKPHEHNGSSKKITTREKIISIVFIVLSIIFYISNNTGLGNLTIVVFLLTLLRKYILEKLIKDFQQKFWPKVIAWYEKILSYSLLNPWKIVGFTGLLFLFTIIGIAFRQ
ncbi:MAG: efflux RND transporter permease subunit, partial [Solirubrobacteraceae bacterium]